MSQRPASSLVAASNRDRSTLARRVELQRNELAAIAGRIRRFRHELAGDPDSTLFAVFADAVASVNAAVRSLTYAAAAADRRRHPTEQDPDE